MRPAQDQTRRDLRELLEGGNAHLDLEAAVKDFPASLRGKRPEGLPYSGWELLEHMRITQNDVLEFIRDPDYVSPSWPEGYWPKAPAPPDARAWTRSIASFRADRKTILKLVADPRRNLEEPFAHGSGQTLLREALLVADHTAYHLGQMIVVRRLLGAWEE
jgi:hypothetical protein